MNLSTNIRKLRKLKKMTQSDLGAILGISRQQIAGYENVKGNETIPLKSVIKMSELFNISIDELVKSDSTANYQPKETNQMVEEPRAAYMSTSSKTPKTYDIHNPPVFQATHNEGFIPYYDIDATASDLHRYQDMEEAPDGFIKFPGVEQCDFALPVYGDSMIPDIRSGDYVGVSFVKEDAFHNFGEKYLVITKEQRLIKFLHPHPTSDLHFILRSKNKHHEDIKILREDVKNLYLVRFVFRREI